MTVRISSDKHCPLMPLLMEKTEKHDFWYKHLAQTKIKGQDIGKQKD